MLTARMTREKEVKYLIIITLREVDKEDDQKADGGNVYRQTLVTEE